MCKYTWEKYESISTSLSYGLNSRIDGVLQPKVGNQSIIEMATYCEKIYLVSHESRLERPSVYDVQHVTVTHISKAFLCILIL